MGAVEDVLQRMAEDRAFAQAVETNPADALRGQALSAADLRRIEQAVASVREFATPASGVATRAAVRRVPRVAVLAAMAPLLGVGAYALTSTGTVADAARSVTLRRDAVVLYACPTAEGSGPVIGSVHRGDRVRIIGRTGSNWLVIRHPNDLRRPAWVPTKAITADSPGASGQLDELTCAGAFSATARADGPTSAAPATTLVLAPTTVASPATIAPTTAPQTAPPTTQPATTRPPTTQPVTTVARPTTTQPRVTTTRVPTTRANPVVTTVPAAPAPVVVSTAKPVAVPTPAASPETPAQLPPAPPPTTLAPVTIPASAPAPIPLPPAPVTTTPQPVTTTTVADKTGPVISIAPSRAHLYTASNLPPCKDEGTVDLVVTVTDPSAPTAITAATWSFTGSNGVVRTGTLALVSPGRYRFGPVETGGPSGGSVPVTFSITAADGAANSSTKNASVDLRAAAAVCIG